MGKKGFYAVVKLGDVALAVVSPPVF